MIWKISEQGNESGMRKEEGERRNEVAVISVRWPSLSLDSDSSVISIICEEPAKSLVLEMSPAAHRQTNPVLISSLKLNANQQACVVFVMYGN